MRPNKHTNTSIRMLIRLVFDCLYRLGKRRSRTGSEIRINSRARTGYNPILNDVKLNSGVAIDGYFDRGAATNRAVKSQNLTD